MALLPALARRRPGTRPNRLVAIAALIALGRAGPVSAAGLGDLVEAHGFLLGMATGRTTGVPPPRGEGGDLVLGEERLRLEIAGTDESGESSLLARSDIFHDAIENRVDVDLREGYVGFSRAFLDARLGRQVLTWGVGDLLFVNDVFPKDWESFFSGRPMEYLKLGVDALLVSLSPALASADLVVIPFFTPDVLPSTARFSVEDPAPGAASRREERPEAGYSTTEIAFRLHGNLWDLDLSAYAYRGFWRTPGVRFDPASEDAAATFFFPRLSVYGGSAQTNLLGGVASLEGGYYDSRRDRAGDDPTVPNSQLRFLAGYQIEPWAESLAGLQGYIEVMRGFEAYRKSLPSGSPIQDEIRFVASVRLAQWLDYRTWKLSLFAAASPTDRDYFLQPEISFKATDALGLATGGNVFGGESSTTFFGQLDADDNLYLRARFDF